MRAAAEIISHFPYVCIGGIAKMIYSSRKFITQNYNPKQNHRKYKQSTAQTYILLPTLNPKNK